MPAGIAIDEKEREEIQKAQNARDRESSAPAEIHHGQRHQGHAAHVDRSHKESWRRSDPDHRPNTDRPGWPRIFDLVFKADAENAKCTRQIASSSDIAVFVAQKQNHQHWVLAGRACQRFALRASALGLKIAFINQPVEVARLRPELANLVSAPGRRPDLMMRFGYGPSLPYSARRPIERTMPP
jgi:hypothetical protein